LGLWSSITSIAKKVWRGVKAVVRIVVRAAITIVAAGVNGFDLLLGFLAWPPKKLRLHVFILRDENGVPVATPGELTIALDNAHRIFKDRFNVSVVPYSKSFVETLPDAAPKAALEPHCDAGAWADLFREAGEYYADHLAGWVGGIPISASFPITAYVVRDVDGKRGCAIGPLTDYLTIDPTGFKGDDTTLAHETGHCCHLWHSGSKGNLMWRDADRGDGVKWFQKNLVRRCRHVTYW
jgi:hypothetical protein